MIVSRVVEHMKQQHWTGVFIELVIVILGVFIGLQVQEWASARAEQRRADVLFQQLLGDLDSEKSNLQADRDYLEVTAAYARTAMSDLETPGSVDPGTWVASAYQATQVYEAQGNRSTFDEMKSTGAIDLIRDARMRALLIGYYDFRWSETTTARAQAPYRELARSILPIAIQEAVKTSCGDRREFIGNLLVARLPKTCHIDIPPAQIASAAAALRDTPGLLPALTYQLSMIQTKIDLIAATQQQLEAVKAAAGKATP